MAHDEEQRAAATSAILSRTDLTNAEKVSALGFMQLTPDERKQLTSRNTRYRYTALLEELGIAARQRPGRPRRLQVVN